jgi:hypothetical protein
VKFFDVRNYFEVGGSLLVQCGDALPLGSGLGLSATGFFGQDFSGWTVGLRLLF